jgi:hypothetical protein
LRVACEGPGQRRGGLADKQTNKKGLVEEVPEEANLIHEVLVDVHLLLLARLGLEVEILRDLEDVLEGLLVCRLEGAQGEGG